MSSLTHPGGRPLAVDLRALHVRRPSLTTARDVVTWRRTLQVALGLVWLLDAALQFQPFMFGRGFATQVIAPTAQGNPAVIANPIVWSAHVVLAHPVLWNALFATAQLLLALGLFWRPTVKLALASSMVWSLLLWWLAEGFGGLFAGTPSPLDGAPGAVILYGFLAILLWPGSREDASIATSSPLRRWASVGWLALWLGEAYLTLQPVNRSASALATAVAGLADGEPRWLGGIDNAAANLLRHAGPGAGIALGCALTLIALSVFVPSRWERPLFAFAVVFALVLWIVGQDLGGILTGQGTDPNSAPLLALIACAYRPLAVRSGQLRQLGGGRDADTRLDG